jgi:hypothetical protein
MTDSKISPTTLAYKAIIEVEVHVELDPGINNPIQGYEPPYEYVVVRNAELIELIEGPKIKDAAAIMYFGGVDEFDPDVLMEEAATGIPYKEDHEG